MDFVRVTAKGGGRELECASLRMTVTACDPDDLKKMTREKNSKKYRPFARKLVEEGSVAGDWLSGLLSIPRVALRHCTKQKPTEKPRRRIAQVEAEPLEKVLLGVRRTQVEAALPGDDGEAGKVDRQSGPNDASCGLVSIAAASHAAARDGTRPQLQTSDGALAVERLRDARQRCAKAAPEWVRRGRNGEHSVSLQPALGRRTITTQSG